MKARDGYSLVEVMVVMVILSALAVIGTMNYREYSQRYQAESQTRMLFQEILKARSDALYLRRGARLKIYRARFEVYSSGSDNGDNPVRTVPLRFPLRCSGELDGEGLPLVFDSRGVAQTGCTICLDTESRGAVDSVVVSKTRVRIGKSEDPTVCEPDRVSTR